MNDLFISLQIEYKLEMFLHGGQINIFLLYINNHMCKPTNML